jgi:hypothetical protein
MTNSKTNAEQDQLFSQSPNQLNCGAAKASDFVVEDSGPGQTGDTKAERAALLAEVDCLGEPIPDRNEVPSGVPRVSASAIMSQGNADAHRND